MFFTVPVDGRLALWMAADCDRRIWLASADMFAVAIEQLRQLARDLESVAATVHQNAGRDRGLADGLAGNGVVTERMRSVEHDWSRQRGTICRYLSALSLAAGSAADLYAAVEVELVKSMPLGPTAAPALPPGPTSLPPGPTSLPPSQTSQRRGSR